MEWLKLASLLALLPAVLAALPNGWKACKRNATDFNTCLGKSIVFAVSTLVNGDKKLGVLPLDPLKVDSIDVPRHDGPVAINWSLKDVKVKGIKNVDLKVTKSDWETFNAVAHIPHLSILGNYKIDGQVLVLPIKGDGKCNITLETLEMDITAQWIRTAMKGKKHFSMEKLHIELKPKKAYIRFDNLFNGDKTLGDGMNKFLNENWQQIYGELKPPITEAISQVLSQIGNKILHKIPAEEIDVY